MMRTKIFAKGRTYDVHAFLEEDFSVTIKKGGTISSDAGTSISGKVRALREDRTCVSEDGIINKDIHFKSVSTAACFVTGTMSNGFKVWKYEKTNKLIERV